MTFAGSHRVGDVQLHGCIDLQRPRDLDTGKQLAPRQGSTPPSAPTRACGAGPWGPSANLRSPFRHRNANANVLGLRWSTCTPAPALRATTLARVDNLADKDYQLVRTYATGAARFRGPEVGTRSDPGMTASRRPLPGAADCRPGLRAGKTTVTAALAPCMRRGRRAGVQVRAGFLDPHWHQLASGARAPAGPVDEWRGPTAASACMLRRSAVDLIPSKA